MAIIGGEVRRAGEVRLKPVAVPADEAVAGDRVRDQGILRRIAFVEPSVVELALRWHFDPVEGYDDSLSVPLFQSVSVWRVCRDR